VPVFLRAAIAVHAVASFAYWIARPRGFDLFSRPFLEHQTVVPALFAVSVAGLVPNRPRMTWIVVGVLAGFWIGAGGTVAVAGTTIYSRPFWGVAAAALLLLIYSRRRMRPDPPALLTGGTVAGLALAGFFWFSAWAPPADTRPRGTVPAPALSETPDSMHVRLRGSQVEIDAGGRKALLWPGFDYGSVSDNGFWTIFRFRSSRLPPWTSSRGDDGSLVLRAENEDFQSACRIRFEGRTVRVRCETRVLREVASHLSSVMQLHLPGPAAVEGIPWERDHGHDRTEFVAMRRGRLEFLRASSREKGPFETLGAWEVRDPLLTIDGWNVRVEGWAEQGSRAPSPTAGWGVSQAAIERAGATYLWSLASTSIGRGWHTVRTGPGVYVLEAVLIPP
jgi:hypothetical protein